MSNTNTPAEIVAAIRADWARPYFGAVPYLDALEAVPTWDTRIGFETARDVAPYLLSNLRTWKGETARTVKAQLQEVSR